VHTLMHTYTHKNTHIHARAHTHTHTHTCARVHTNTHTHVRAYTQIHTHMQGWGDGEECGNEEGGGEGERMKRKRCATKAVVGG